MAVARKTEHSVLTSLSVEANGNRMAAERAPAGGAPRADRGARSGGARLAPRRPRKRARSRRKIAIECEGRGRAKKRGSRSSGEASERKPSNDLAETRLAQGWRADGERSRERSGRRGWSRAVVARARRVRADLSRVESKRSSEQAKERGGSRFAREREMRRGSKSCGLAGLDPTWKLARVGRTSKAIDDLARAERRASAVARGNDRLRAGSAAARTTADRAREGAHQAKHAGRDNKKCRRSPR